MRRVPGLLVLFVLLAALPAMSACGYKKAVKRAAPNSLECEASLVTSKKRRDVVTASGCGNSAKYMYFCADKDCKLLSFETALQEGAFAAACSPDEMAVVVTGRGELAIDGCGKRVNYKASLNGWEQDGDVQGG